MISMIQGLALIAILLSKDKYSAAYSTYSSYAQKTQKRNRARASFTGHCLGKTCSCFTACEETLWWKTPS